MLLAMVESLRDITESFGGRMSWLSTAYRCQHTASCLRLLRQPTVRALSLALARAGKSRAARMAIMAMTTSSSMRVNARRKPAAPAQENTLSLLGRQVAGGTRGFITLGTAPVHQKCIRILFLCQIIQPQSDLLGFLARRVRRKDQHPILEALANPRRR